MCSRDAIGHSGYLRFLIRWEPVQQSRMMTNADRKARTTMTKMTNEQEINTKTKSRNGRCYRRTPQLAANTIDNDGGRGTEAKKRLMRVRVSLSATGYQHCIPIPNSRELWWWRRRARQASAPKWVCTIPLEFRW